MGIRWGLLAGVVAATVQFACVNACAGMIHWQVNDQKSQLKASVAEPLAKLRDTAEAEGTFHIISGDIDGDPDKPADTGHVRLQIDATSYDSGNRHRDNAVLSSALDTADYQTISFESTRIENVQIDVPRKMGSADVYGNLTLHGTTREIRVPVSVAVSPEGGLIVDGQVTLHYTEFGVGVPRLLFALPVGKEATISFHIVAGRSNSAQAMR